MKCHDAMRLLGPWSDGELDADRAHELESHLSQCASCKAEQDSQRHVSAALRLEFQASAPDDLAERAFQTAMESKPLRRSFFETLLPIAWPTAVATSAAAMVLVVWMLVGGPATLASENEVDLLDEVLSSSSTEVVEGVLQGALGIDSTTQPSGDMR